MSQNRYETFDEEFFKNPKVIEKINQRFNAAEERFHGGDRSALFSVLCLCAQYQATIPEWAADELLQGASDLGCGSLDDFNELFGSQGLPSRTRRRREAEINANQERVVSRLKAHRCRPDGSFNAEYAFGAVAEETGLPRRMVEEIYRRNKNSLKQIHQGNPEGAVILDTIFADLPILRRRGRPLL